MSLNDIDYSSGAMVTVERRLTAGTGTLDDHLASAEAVLDGLELLTASPQGLPETSADFEHLRWFPYPDEVLASRSEVRRPA